MRYLLVGNYGTGNFGDEALKEYFLSAFPEAKFQVLSAHPKGGELPRLSAGIRSFLLTRWWRTVAVFRRSDGLVFGGGTLFTDIESVRACLLWWWHAFVCRLLGKPYYLAFQGIGPFRTKVGEWCARFAMSHAAFVSVRDQDSFDRVKLWRKNTNIIQTADPVFSLFAAQNKDSGSQKLLVIIPRNNSPKSFLLRAITLVREKEWGGVHVHVLSLKPDDKQEQALCSHIAQVTRGTVRPVRTVDDLIHELSGASFVLAQRYHGALAAFALGIPFETVSQGEGDKLSSVSAMPSADVLALVREGERYLKSALFPELSGSGKIQL